MTSKPRAEFFRNSNAVDPEAMAQTIAMWRDVETYPSALSIADALGCSQSAVRRRIKNAIASGAQCFYRSDLSVKAAQWFSGAKKGV